VFGLCVFWRVGARRYTVNRVYGQTVRGGRRRVAARPEPLPPPRERSPSSLPLPPRSCPFFPHSIFLCFSLAEAGHRVRWMADGECVRACVRACVGGGVAIRELLPRGAYLR
jgi:hypothetical protein